MEPVSHHFPAFFLVFVTMDRSRSNSMTESGQCKLAPLVLCVQESNQLYDFCVKFLFKLHESKFGIQKYHSLLPFLTD